jgi:hypothetical protein
VWRSQRRGGGGGGATILNGRLTLQLDQAAWAHGRGDEAMEEAEQLKLELPSTSSSQPLIATHFFCLLK